MKASFKEVEVGTKFSCFSFVRYLGRRNGSNITYCLCKCNHGRFLILRKDRLSKTKSCRGCKSYDDLNLDMYDSSYLNDLSRKIVMNKDIAVCVGLHQGDGCLYRDTRTGRWIFHYGSTDKYLVEYVKDRLGIDNNIYVSKDDRKESYKDYYRVQSYSDYITSFFTDLSYSDRKQVDVKLLSESLHGYEGEFLYGLLESDGYVTLSECREQVYVEWVSDDNSIADYVQGILLNNGVRCFKNKQDRISLHSLYVVRVVGKELLKLGFVFENYIEGSRKYKRYQDILVSLGRES